MPGSGATDIAATAARWFATHPEPASGAALVCYRAGATAPVGVATTAFASAPSPHSLDVILHTPPAILMVISLSGDYIGPGEYKGGADDVMVGLGVADADGAASTWTAAAGTASDLTTYGPGAEATAGTLTSFGLVSGPVFGPPEGDQPACAVLFSWFELGGS